MSARPDEAAVSVVIPVYNTRRYLAECLDSVLAQDLTPHELEVIAVDDGSTDGSAQVLDRYAERHPNLRVIHQENSGWPGRPRNVGRAASQGQYVFFVDSDDCLAPQALRSMYDFAVQHDSDIVVPKIVPLDGSRRPNQVVWRRTRVDADLTRVIQTLGPWKLFRRAFLDEQDIWFPEGKVRLEDGIFVTQAYLVARRVSVLADDVLRLETEVQLHPDAQSDFDAFFPEGLLYYWKSLYLDHLDDEVINALIVNAEDRPSPQTPLVVRHLGGAISRVPEEATAYGNRTATFNLSIDSTWEDPTESERNLAWTRKVWTEMRQFSDGGIYLNFAGFLEEGEKLLHEAHGENYERLVDLKNKYDPTNLFRLNHNIKPTV